uniref:PDZ domain-containing protein n=1 Tax=Guillardia theta TaxID=55529 RepID=A0A7S4PQG2_GUITH|mmetsp:Transcript_9044/g.30152  ORF Transcript_9044/g.30152 Transcript_9044/m.30152 type:complete len:395 (+) Transcript_9044:131-1315(+)
MVNTNMESTAEYIGIGAQVQRQDSKSSCFILTSFVKGGAAESCGMLREGDELLTVDKKDVRCMDQREVEQQLMGPEGSHVQLKIVRDGRHVFTACLERHKPILVKPREVPSGRDVAPRAEDLNISERIYSGMAKINAVKYKLPEKRLTPEEVKEWRRKHDAEIARNDKMAQQMHDARLRRHAEIGVLQRELNDLVRQKAPFAKILEYENWIKRLELEDEFGPGWVAEVDTLELQTVKEEAEERLVKLKEILKLLLSSEEGEGGEGRIAEIAAISSKIKENETILSRVRKNLGLASVSSVEPHQSAATGGDGEEAVARESSKDEAAENQPSEKRKKLVSSEVAADLGNRWKSHEAEPRQGIGVVAEGTIESAPEPCMLASTTQSAIASLFNVHIS